MITILHWRPFGSTFHLRPFGSKLHWRPFGSASRNILLTCVGCAAAVCTTGAAGLAWTDRQMEDFLLRAEITGAQELPIGVTGSQRATLSLAGTSHHAHIQTVDVEERNARINGRTELIFRDSYRYNVAAYRLDRMLDLHMVPVSVERTVEGKNAAVTWWVDDVRMMEKERVEQQVRPPGSRAWIEQVYRRRVFNELVYNTDFNQSNQLITGDWKIWLVDFTRAFRPLKRLFRAANLWRIDEPLLDRLRALTRERVDDRLDCCLSRPERRALLARRDLIVQHYEREAAAQAQAAVEVF